MNLNTFKTLLLGINSILALAVLGFGTMLALNFNKMVGGDELEAINGIKVLKVDPDQWSENTQEPDSSIFGSFPDIAPVTKNEGLVARTNPIDTKKKDPIVLPLKNYITIVGFLGRGKNTTIIIQHLKDKSQDTLTYGDYIDVAGSKAQFLGSSKSYTALFLYNGKEVEVVMEIEVPERISTPVGDQSLKELVNNTGRQATPRVRRRDAIKKAKPDTTPLVTPVASSAGDASIGKFDEDTDTWSFSMEEVVTLEKNFDTYKKEIKFQPSKQGLSIRSISRNSRVNRYGFKSGDVIVSVNNIKVTSTAQLNSLRQNQDLRNASRINVVFLRGGRQQTLTFENTAASQKPR